MAKQVSGRDDRGVCPLKPMLVPHTRRGHWFGMLLTNEDARPNYRHHYNGQDYKGNHYAQCEARCL
jgi:hypothetical protein